MEDRNHIVNIRAEYGSSEDLVTFRRRNGSRRQYLTPSSRSLVLLARACKKLEEHTEPCYRGWVFWRDGVKKNLDVETLYDALRKIEMLLLTVPHTERESHIYSIACPALNLVEGRAVYRQQQAEASGCL